MKSVEQIEGDRNHDDIAGLLVCYTVADEHDAQAHLVFP
jgi:hypothetical protein